VVNGEGLNHLCGHEIILRIVMLHVYRRPHASDSLQEKMALTDDDPLDRQPSTYPSIAAYTSSTSLSRSGSWKFSAR
jgi:hypothetical protein